MLQKSPHALIWKVTDYPASRNGPDKRRTFVVGKRTSLKFFSAGARSAGDIHSLVSKPPLLWNDGMRAARPPSHLA